MSRSDGPAPTTARHRDRLRARVLLSAALTVVVALALDAATGSRSPVTAPRASSAAVLPRRDAVSTAWYCAEGTSSPNGRADESVVVANLGTRAVRADVTVMASEVASPARRTITVGPRAEAAVRVADVLAVTDPGVLVEVFGGPAVVEHVVRGNGDVGAEPCATAPSRSWHFAAGTTAAGAQLWLSLFNPFGDDAIVDVSFVTDQGVRVPEELKSFVVPRRTKVAVAVHDHVRRVDQVATDVETRAGRVIAEESLVLAGSDGRRGLTLALGSPAPRPAWVLASGGGAGTRREVLALTNPGDVAASVVVDTVLDGGVATLQPQTVVVPARSVVQTDLDARVPPGAGFWVALRARGAPVVAEQLTATGAALADTFGVAEPAERWALAVARLGSQSVDQVVVVNPGSRVATLEVTAIGGGHLTRPGGARRIRIAPRTRAVLDLGGLGVPPAAALVVDANRPVVVERRSADGAGLTVGPAVPDLG